MKISFVVLKVVVLAALLIISNGNLALHDSENRQVFWEQYYGWLSSAFDRTVYITGYMVRSEWLPQAPGDGTTFDQVLRINGTKR